MRRAVSTCEPVGGRFELELFGEIPLVQADPETTASALASLLAHSGRATEWSTTVRVQAYAKAEAVELCISADGPSAAEEEIEALASARPDEETPECSLVAELLGPDVERARVTLNLQGSQLELVDRHGSDARSASGSG